LLVNDVVADAVRGREAADVDRAVTRAIVEIRLMEGVAVDSEPTEPLPGAELDPLGRVISVRAGLVTGQAHRPEAVVAVAGRVVFAEVIVLERVTRQAECVDISRAELLPVDWGADIVVRAATMRRRGGLGGGWSRGDQARQGARQNRDRQCRHAELGRQHGLLPFTGWS